MKRLGWAIFIFFSSYSLNTYALSGFTLASGTGAPDNLRGARASLVWDWNTHWLERYAITLTGFWDVSAAYWRTDGNNEGQFKNLGSFAAAPVFRIIANPRYDWPITPFIELSVGLAVHTNSYIGKRDLGSAFAFQDLLGFGFAFGKKRQFALSYHYLHYSNANLAMPNRGVDAKYLFQMMYLFD